MGHEFDMQIQVSEAGAGRYEAELADGWVVGGGVNGGYVLAVIGNAIGTALPAKPDPITMSAYFLSPSTPGPATVAVDVRRDGGRFATVAAEISQGGTTRIATLATFGEVRDSGDVRTTATEIDLPPLEECVSNEFAPPEVKKIAPLMERFDMRFHPDHVGWVVGTPSGRGELSAWFRLIDGRDPDPLELLMVVDALPPVTFDLGQMGWAPTLELTAHIRARPAPGWLKVRHATRNVAGGMFEEDCEVWDSAGRLVAQSRQLALLPRGGS
jgi:acyl-CoA thioesterase